MKVDVVIVGGGFAGDGGPAIAGELDNPGGIVADSSGNLFIADRGNDRIRFVDSASKTLSTFAGDGSMIFSGRPMRAMEHLRQRTSHAHRSILRTRSSRRL